jgi:hypothetical protein
VAWQQGVPATPQAPALQPPARHEPAPWHTPVTAATHVFALLSQQPPLLHALPSQQGSAVPPQATHLFVVGLHARSLAVQKFVATPPSPGVPVQQGWVLPPQPPQLPLAQVPRAPGQALAAATHSPPTQQPLAPHVLSAQQTVVPQAVETAFEHTVVPASFVLCPLATQVPPTQQPPPEQLPPAQHTSPAAPQVVHLSPAHTDCVVPTVVQATALPTHVPVGPPVVSLTSQHSVELPASPPPGQVLPLQHGPFVAPHAAHVVPLQMPAPMLQDALVPTQRLVAGSQQSPVPVQVELPQHCWFVLPHGTHCAPLHARLPEHESVAATHAAGLTPVSQQPTLQPLPGQQFWPGTPQPTHVPDVHTAVPPVHVVPLLMHVNEPGSQHSLLLLQVVPRQHAWLPPPQGTH